jgi:hypothetical protein
MREGRHRCLRPYLNYLGVDAFLPEKAFLLGQRQGDKVTNG